MKPRIFKDDSSPSLAARVRMLEIDLAEKTELLEKATKKLADSQKQYQMLLYEFENFKSKGFSPEFNSNYSFSQNGDNSYMNFNSSFSSFDDSNSNVLNNYNKSIKQIQKVEGNVQNLSMQIFSLKSKIDKLTTDQQAWKNFANSVFGSIREFVCLKKDFPEDDGEAQRFILLDLIQKLTKRCSTELDESLAKKYRISKLKLKKVQMKCDKMLQLLGEKGYDISSFEETASKHKKKKIFQRENFDFLDSDDFGKNFDSNDCKNSDDIIDFETSDDIIDFKNDVKKLSDVSQSMKDHYKNYVHLAKKRKRKL